MHIMQGLSQIVNLPQDIACSWVEIFWLGEVRNKILLQGLVQNIMPENYFKWS